MVLASTEYLESASAETADTLTQTTSLGMHKPVNPSSAGSSYSGTESGLKWRVSVLIN